MKTKRFFVLSLCTLFTFGGYAQLRVDSLGRMGVGIKDSTPNIYKHKNYASTMISPSSEQGIIYIGNDTTLNTNLKYPWFVKNISINPTICVAVFIFPQIEAAITVPFSAAT